MSGPDCWSIVSSTHLIWQLVRRLSAVSPVRTLTAPAETQTSCWYASAPNRTRTARSVQARAWACTSSSPKRWCDLAGATGTGISAFEGVSFIRGQSTPDSTVLAGRAGPFQAGLNHLAATADDLCLFHLEKRRVGVPDREKQLKVLAQASSAVAPSHQI